ncbi:hypothetical protein DENSPDRAFT_787561, partial [Dentipellis sp. KUC8613]
QYLFTMALTVLLYDHMLTFPAEVRTLWERKKTYRVLFFLIARYHASLAMIVASVGYFSPAVTSDICRRWMFFIPLGITIPLTLFPGIIMLLRVYALYGRNRLVASGLCTILVAQLLVAIWQLTFPGAILAPATDNPIQRGHTSSVYMCLSLSYDTAIFCLTLGRTSYIFWRHEGRGRTSRNLVDSLIQDGALYFASIFSINLTWVAMIFHASKGLRDAAAM